MAIRVSPPAESHNDTPARFKRTLAEAFPAGTQRIGVPRRISLPNRAGAWLISALIAFIAITLTGCSGAEAQVKPLTKSELRRAAAGEWNCPGMTAVWIDETTVQCHKDAQ